MFIITFTRDFFDPEGSFFSFSEYSRSDYYKRLGQHSCSKCGKEYRWMQSLIRHSREECCKEPQHCCSICGIRIRHKWMLKKHMNTVHHINLIDLPKLLH